MLLASEGGREFRDCRIGMSVVCHSHLIVGGRTGLLEFECCHRECQEV